MKNNKRKSMFTWISSISMLVLGFATLITGAHVYKRTFKVQPHEIKRRRLHEKRLAILEKYEHQTFMIESSKNGYSIEVLHAKSSMKSNDVIVLVHGIRGNYYDLLSVAFKYLDDGCNVILYNQRQSGLTGGDNSTFGLYERFDLEEVATIAKRLYKNGKVGVHGFSMGAATAIMQSELNEHSNLVDFYILDAPFHTMTSAIDLNVEHDEKNRIPKWYVKFAGDLFLRLKEQVTYKDIVPLDAIKHTTKPVLLIHGEKDTVTMPDGSRALYDAISHDEKRLEIFPDQEHCTAYFREEADYFKKIYDFLENIVWKA